MSATFHCSRCGVSLLLNAAAAPSSSPSITSPPPSVTTRGLSGSAPGQLDGTPQSLHAVLDAAAAQVSETELTSALRLGWNTSDGVRRRSSDDGEAEREAAVWRSRGLTVASAALIGLGNVQLKAKEFARASALFHAASSASQLIDGVTALYQPPLSEALVDWLRRLPCSFVRCFGAVLARPPSSTQIRAACISDTQLGCALHVVRQLADVGLCSERGEADGGSLAIGSLLVDLFGESSSESDRRLLDAIRLVAREELSELSRSFPLAVAAADWGVDAYSRSRRVEDLYWQQARYLLSFFQVLIDRVHTFLAGCGVSVPCDYAVIALGSLAREEATPFSDVEFAVLVDAENPRTLSYFRCLTHLLYQIVLDLGETILPAVDVPCLRGWFHDRWTKRGVAFDGQMSRACKTPLGKATMWDPTAGADARGQQVDGYELIRTPARMAEFQSPDWERKDGLLGVELLTFRLIHGRNAERLLDEYRRECSVFLDVTVPRMSQQATPMLQTVRQQRAIRRLRSDEATYQTHVGEERTDFQTPEVKRELYRFLSVCIESVYWLCLDSISAAAAEDGRNATSTWDRVDALRVRGMLTEAGAANLRLAVSIAAQTRLGTYLAYGRQKEGIRPVRYERAAPGSPEAPFEVPIEWLLRYYCTARQFQIGCSYICDWAEGVVQTERSYQSAVELCVAALGAPGGTLWSDNRLIRGSICDRYGLVDMAAEEYGAEVAHRPSAAAHFALGTHLLKRGREEGAEHIRLAKELDAAAEDSRRRAAGSAVPLTGITRTTYLSWFEDREHVFNVVSAEVRTSGISQRFALALYHSVRAGRLLNGRFGCWSSRHLEALMTEGYLCAMTGTPGHALAGYALLRAALQRVSTLSGQRLLTAQLHDNLAVCCRRLQRFEDSIAHGMAAYKLFVAIYNGAPSPALCICLHGRANDHLAWGQHRVADQRVSADKRREGLQLIERSLSLLHDEVAAWRFLYPADPARIEVVKALHTIGQVHRYLAPFVRNQVEQYSTALHYCRQARQLLRCREQIVSFEPLIEQIDRDINDLINRLGR